MSHKKRSTNFSKREVLRDVSINGLAPRFDDDGILNSTDATMGEHFLAQENCIDISVDSTAMPPNSKEQPEYAIDWSKNQPAILRRQPNHLLKTPKTQKRKKTPDIGTLKKQILEQQLKHARLEHQQKLENARLEHQQKLENARLEHQQRIVHYAEEHNIKIKILQARLKNINQ